MYWNGDHMDGGWSVAMLLGMLIFWTALVIAVVWAIHSSRPSNLPGERSGTSPVDGRDGAPEDILANRLARGEIDPEEYRSRLDVLRSANTR